MATVNEIVSARKVYFIESDHSVLEAARAMKEHGIGALPVVRGSDLVGIISERDIMNRVVAAGRNPGTTAISEVMTSAPKTVNIDESEEDCLFLMSEFGFRHLPVVEGSELRGVVSLRDLALRYLAHQHMRRAS
jgi:CBS domain-containing protein